MRIAATEARAHRQRLVGVAKQWTPLVYGVLGCDGQQQEQVHRVADLQGLHAHGNVLALRCLASRPPRVQKCPQVGGHHLHTGPGLSEKYVCRLRLLAAPLGA